MARVPRRGVLIGQRAGYQGLPLRGGQLGSRRPVAHGRLASEQEHKKEERKPVHTSSLAG